MKKKHIRVLREITESVPKELLDQLITTGPIAPIVKTVVEKAIADPDVPEEKKSQLRSILKLGYLDKEVDNVDKGVEAKISKYIDDEIEKAIQLGRLPKEDKELIKKAKKLQKEYEKEKKGS